MKIGFDLRRHTKLLTRAARRAMRLRGEESGTELVEFAFVLPGLMIVLTGTISFALALYNLQQLGNGTSAAVQAVADEAGLITDPCAQAVTSLTAALPKWTAAKFTYTMVITDSSNATHTYGPTTGSSFSCTAGAVEEAQNYPVVLTVSYAYTWLPILRFSPSSPLKATEGTTAD